MSNLVHRRRRCARIVTYMILCLDGSTPEDGSGAFTNLKYSLWLQRSLFCTVKGSYFVLWLSVCQWADQMDGEGQTGKLAYVAEHTHQAARA